MTRSLHTVLNESNPSKLGLAGRAVELGNAVGHIRTAKVSVAANVATLPNGAKALQLLGGYRTAGTATGAIQPVGPGATLATGQAQVDANGNIAFLAADAVSSAEVTYLSYEGETITVTGASVVGGVYTVGGGGARLLISATVGGSALAIAARSNATPSAGNAHLNLTGSQVRFASGVTEATIIYAPFPVQTVDAALRSQVGF